MELLIGIIVGVVAASVGFISALRRAKAKPAGKTASVMNLVSGGGGGPDPGPP
jgi:hypothetical protein